MNIEIKLAIVIKPHTKVPTTVQKQMKSKQLKMFRRDRSKTFKIKIKTDSKLKTDKAVQYTILLCRSRLVQYTILLRSRAVQYTILFRSRAVQYTLLFRSRAVQYTILFRSRAVQYTTLFRSRAVQYTIL